jgi:DNA-binding PadR family transcriptional regulator
MSILEYHILLALADGPLYGLAISSAVAAESRGAHTPRAGSLYRVIARLMADGLVKETDPRVKSPRIPASSAATMDLRPRERRRLRPRRIA